MYKNSYNKQLRIISGKFKGINIELTTRHITRPTTNKVKKTFFEIISKKLKGANILDLFAGTGSLGIEGLSRGANKVVFVDNINKTLINLKYNLEKFNINKNFYIIKCNILENLQNLKKIRIKYNIVFMDPPYNHGMVIPSLVNIIKYKILIKRTNILVEHGVKENILINLPRKMSLIFQKTYGEKTISYFIFMKN